MADLPTSKRRVVSAVAPGDLVPISVKVGTAYEQAAAPASLLGGPGGAAVDETARLAAATAGAKGDTALAAATSAATAAQTATATATTANTTAGAANQTALAAQSAATTATTTATAAQTAASAALPRTGGTLMGPARLAVGVPAGGATLAFNAAEKNAFAPPPLTANATLAKPTGLVAGEYWSGSALIVIGGAGGWTMTPGTGVKPAEDGALSLPTSPGAEATLFMWTFDGGTVYAMVVGGGGSAAPGQVGTVSVGSPAANTLPLAWTSPPSGGAATGHTITWRIVGSGSAYASVNTGTALAYTLASLAAGTAYEGAVAAFNASGTGTARTWTGTTAAAALPVVQVGSLSQASAAEGTAGGSGASFVLTLNRTGDTSGTSSVSATPSGTGGSPASADDIVGGFAARTVNFAAGAASATVTFVTAPDADFEGNEVVTLTLSAPSGCTLGATTTTSFTITNDDAAPVTGTISGYAPDAGKPGTFALSAVASITYACIVKSDGTQTAPRVAVAANATTAALTPDGLDTAGSRGARFAAATGGTPFAQTDPFRVWPALPTVPRVHVTGDSLVQQWHTPINGATATNMASVTKGDLLWAAMLDPWFDASTWSDGTNSRYFVGANNGYTGTTAMQRDAGYAAEVGARAAHVVVIPVGTNSLADPLTLPAVRSIADKAIADGKRPVVCTVTPWNSGASADTSAKRAAYGPHNAGVRAMEADSKGSILVCDLAAAFGVPSDFAYPSDTALFDDGLHRSVKGARLAGIALRDTLARLKPAGAGNRFLAMTGNLVPAGQANFSGGLAGGSDKGTGATGDLPAGFTCFQANTGSLVAFSLEDNATTGGKTMVMTVTPNGSTGSEVINVQLKTDAPFATASGVTQMWAEVEFDAWDRWGGFQQNAREMASGTATGRQVTANQALNTLPKPAVAETLWVHTDPMRNGAGVTAIRALHQIVARPVGATGTGVVKVKRWGVFPVPDPAVAWGY